MMIIDLAVMQHKIMNTESIDDLHQAQVELTKYAGELNSEVLQTSIEIEKIKLANELELTNTLFGISKRREKIIISKEHSIVKLANLIKYGYSQNIVQRIYHLASIKIWKK